MHGLRVNAQPNAGENVKAHRLTLRLTAHSIKVVHEVEQHGRRAADLRIPQRAVLVHG